MFGDRYEVPAMEVVHPGEADGLLQEVTEGEVEHIAVQAPVCVHVPSGRKEACTR